jgi:hypothetical protein
MTGIVLAISAAYVVIGVLLLNMGLASRYAWWIKATVIVVTCGFFIEAFFSTKSLLGWPGAGQLPPRFQLLWTRVVEPDPSSAIRGASLLWVEGVDDNNVPSGTPRAFRLPLLAAARRPVAQGARRDHVGQSPGGHRQRHGKRRSQGQHPGARRAAQRSEPQ